MSILEVRVIENMRLKFLKESIGLTENLSDTGRLFVTIIGCQLSPISDDDSVNVPSRYILTLTLTLTTHVNLSSMNSKHIKNFKPVRVNEDPWLIGNRVWVDEFKRYPSLKTLKIENDRKLLNLPPCIQCYPVQEHLIALTTKGKLVASCTINIQLTVIELIPADSSLNDILIMTDDRTVYWCSIRDSILIIVSHVAHNVQSAVTIGRRLNCMSVLCLLQNTKLVIVRVDPEKDHQEVELEVPEGVKWIEGESHHENTTIVTNTNRLLSLNGELAVIPDLLDIIRMSIYWLAIRENKKLSIINNHVLEFSSDHNFTKFLNPIRLLTDKGSVYTYIHSLASGNIIFDER